MVVVYFKYYYNKKFKNKKIKIGKNSCYILFPELSLSI